MVSFPLAGVLPLGMYALCGHGRIFLSCLMGGLKLYLLPSELGQDNSKSAKALPLALGRLYNYTSDQELTWPHYVPRLHPCLTFRVCETQPCSQLAAMSEVDGIEMHCSELIFACKPLEESSHSFPLHTPSEIENFSTEEGVLASFLQSPPPGLILQSFVMGKFGA